MVLVVAAREKRQLSVSGTRACSGFQLRAGHGAPGLVTLVTGLMLQSKNIES